MFTKIEDKGKRIVEVAGKVRAMQGALGQTVMQRSRKGHSAPITRCLFVVALLALSACSGLGQDEEPRWDTDIPPSEGFDADYPTWGPEGEHIAFQHTLDSAGASSGAYDQLWVANLETGERRMVAPGRVINPNWSPDGKWFVFQTKGIPQYLYKIDVNGENLTRLTGPGSPNPELEYTTEGRWGPRGDRILFAVSAGEPRGLSMMSEDGSGARILVPYGVNGSWFPGGERLAYTNWDTTLAPERRQQIYTARSDGSDIERITDFPESRLTGRPNVSPDGQQIAFTHRGEDGSEEIFLMNADGTNVRQVTEGPGIIYGIEWHPEGSEILFGRFIPNVSERIYLLDAKTYEVEPVFPARNE